MSATSTNAVRFTGNQGPGLKEFGAGDQYQVTHVRAAGGIETFEFIGVCFRCFVSHAG